MLPLFLALYWKDALPARRGDLGPLSDRIANANSGMFEISVIGIVIFGVGMLYMMTIGKRLLPNHQDAAQMEEGIWSAQDTNPSDIEAALRAMLAERHAEHAGYVPARALNLVCVVDKHWSGEVANRLGAVGPHHASRTVVCAIEPRRTTIDAVATIASDVHPGPGEFALLRETVVLDVGERHLPHLNTIIDPLVVTDLPTVLWAPHGHHAAIDVLLGVGQVVLLDTLDEPAVADGLRRACSVLERAYVVDLAWLRSTPWRERVAATFDPPHLRPDLRTLSSVTVRHQPDSSAAALLLVGWLAARLDWRPEPLMPHDGSLVGSVRARRQDVRIALQPVPEQQVRGLAGVTLETAAGRWLSLDRGPGGLRAHYRNAKGDDRRWTVLGASRGEGGILAEGIRQALLRDPVYPSAVEAATRLIG
jgi:glucose-6-phosphate dehydrogenase assembly protein OpcA